ncbi:MAG: ABC transporter ATP-binding protein, partial [Blautia hydrogenotrophica]
MVPPFIELTNLTKNFGNGKGIFDLSFGVQQGEVFGFLGPNGAGKSTTIRHLMGFVKPQSGSCQIMGKDCFSQAALIQQSVGYLAGEIAFIEDMSGISYLNFIADMKGIRDRSSIRDLLYRFELNPRGKIKKMSKGMKQKIGLVAAFMGDPSVLILDEPTSGLDPLMQNRFVELLLERKKKGSTVFMSSHIFEEVEKTCNRTAIIREGRLVDIVQMKELSKLRNRIYTVTLHDKESAQRLAAVKQLDIINVCGRKVQIRVKKELPNTLRVLANYQPTDLQTETQSLEELFLHYYG